MKMQLMNKAAVVFAMAILALASSAARAADDYLQLRYTSANPTQTGYAVLDGVLNTLVYIGKYNLEVQTGGGYTGPISTSIVNQSLNGAIGAFCIDVRQYSSYNFAQYSATTDLANAPVTSGSVMGSAKANDLRKLFAAHWTSHMTANQAAAFQSDIWEIINDTSGTYSLSSGNFRVTESSGSGWVTLGNSWLAELPTLSAMQNDLVALTSATSQDYALTVPGAAADGGNGGGGDGSNGFGTVPEPATIIGVLMGVGGLARYIRRRVGMSI